MSRESTSLLPLGGIKAIRRKGEMEAAEMARLHALSDRALGEAVLAMARDVRRRHPSLAFEKSVEKSKVFNRMNAILLWQVVPDLAGRLGCVLERGEATEPDLVGLRGAALREHVGDVLLLARGLSMLDPFRDATPPCHAHLLERDVAHGNPVAMTLDRVAPANEASHDRCADEVRRASIQWGGKARVAWEPAMAASEPYVDLEAYERLLAGDPDDECAPSFGA